ncbi:prepilin peptidase [Ignatzschineria indica]|uniref:prepilin peptidase n=1 Tax=Ignatzschineria indica TaxID=472583 RepID=UPI0025757709|nr:A24 family peptidase [Ignatzschineria indica]MDM1545442.1 prepilin peptidase [Ignatzschineria indica]
MLLSSLFSPSYKRGEEILSFGTLLRLFLRFFLFLFSLQLLLSLSLSLLFNYQLQWQDRLFLLLLMPLILFDLRYYLIPDPLLYPLLWCGILLSLLQLGPVALESALLGVMGGYLLFEVCYWSGVLFVRREIMGRGDIKLFAALLAWVGVQNLSQLLLLSALLGLGYGFFITLKGILLQRRAEKLEGELERALEVKFAKNLGDKVIPFAPALGFSGIILYFNLQIFGN